MFLFLHIDKKIFTAAGSAAAFRNCKNSFDRVHVSGSFTGKTRENASAKKPLLTPFLNVSMK